MGTWLARVHFPNGHVRYAKQAAGAGFARQFLPSDFDEVRYVFSKRGAYKKFRALLIRRNVLDSWYDFESKATERALREWRELNSIEVAG
jgi:hypothetical protein